MYSFLMRNHPKMLFLFVYIILFNFGQTEAGCPLQCPAYHNSFNCTFYKNSCFDQSVLPNNTGKTPGKPVNLQTKFFDNGNITFTWNADTSTIKYLQGFLLNLTIVKGICKIDSANLIRAFIYSNISQIEKYKNELFSLELRRFCQVVWGLELYSLPKDDCARNVQYQILSLAPITGNLSKRWQTNMTITYSFPLKDIEVNFTKAPESFNFESYRISLNKNNEIIDSKTINKIAEPSVTFDVSVSGVYVVKLHSCLSHTKENTATSCKVERSQTIDATDPCPKNSFSESGSITISIIVVSVLIVIFFIVLIGKYYSHKRLKKVPKKYAMLLCLNDHLLHDKAVQHLIKYLEDFGVTVHYAKKFGKCIFEVYDIVILVNSTALAERQKAWAAQKDYEQFFLEENSSKLTNEIFILIDELSLEKDSHKIISLKFDHTPDSPVFKRYPSQNGNFSIPSNLFDMVQSMVDVSIKFQGFSKKKALLNAIKNAAEYEKRNKNWFSEKYGDPIPENLVSLNSKDSKSMKRNDHNFNKDYSIGSCNVSELLHTIQKKNDQEMQLNFMNRKYIENSTANV